MLQGCFSSLYIGILAATCKGYMPWNTNTSFSSLYIGILAATELQPSTITPVFSFQFPLHRDPRCNG